MKPKEAKIKRTVGLDVHPDSITAAILSGDRALDATVGEVSGELSLDRFIEWAQERCRANDTLVMEASANSFELFLRLNAFGLHTLVLDSGAVGRICKESNITDKSSAIRVARVHLSGLIKDTVWVPDPITRERREVLGSYQEATKDRTRVINRIKSFLNEHLIRFDRRLTTNKARGLILGRKNWSERQQLILNEAFDDLNRAQGKAKKMLREISRDISQTPQMLHMMRIFGLGPITTYALMAMIGDIRRFSSPKKLVAYFGLHPGYKHSGKSEKPTRHRDGRKEVRALLTQGAHTALRCPGSMLHKWAWCLAKRKGWTDQGNTRDNRGKKIAVKAVARKMVVAVWYHLNELPFSAKEQTDNLLSKLRELALSIGIEELKEKGFKSYSDFQEKLLEKMREPTCSPT